LVNLQKLNIKLSMKTILIFKKTILLLVAINLISCSSDDEIMTTTSLTQEYLVGQWNVTSITSESDDNLLVLCSNGKTPNYTFTEDNNLNAKLYSLTDVFTNECETTFIFYTYTFDTETNIITIYTSTGGGVGYQTKIIESNENSFTTQYVSGTIGSEQLTLPNFKTVFQRE